MRLHSLRFAGIGPFRDLQEINFDELASSGLFLIDGPTGAGKTTVIDAIVFALYGDVSGHEAAESRLRSDFCAPGDLSFVECEFTVGDRRVSLRRTPRFERLKARGEGTTTAAASQVLSETDSSGALRVELTQASEIGAYISNLLGMSAQQFRQLVVLPQGEFAELLRMKPAERFAALGPLLGDEFFRRLQVDLDNAGSAARDERARAADAVRSAADALRGVLSDVELDEVSDRLEVVIDPLASHRAEAAQQIVELLAERSAALQKVLAELQAESATVREELGRVEKYLAARTAVDSARIRRSAAFERIAGLDSGPESEHARQRITELNQNLGILQRWVEWEQQAQTRAMESEQVESAIATLLNSIEQLNVSLNALPEERKRYEQTLNALTALAATSEQLSKGLEDLQRNSEQARVLIQLERAFSKAAKTADGAKVAASKAAEDVGEVTAQLDSMLVNYLEERAAALAQALVEGQPCPVCGALEHPHPAEAAHTLVTDSDIEQLRVTLALRSDESKAAAISLEQATAEMAKLEIEVSRMRGALERVEIAYLPSTLESAKQAVGAAEEARAQLPELLERLNQLSESEATINNELKLASLALTAQQTSLELSKSLWQQQATEHSAIVGGADSAEQLALQLTTSVALLEEFVASDQALALATSTLPELAETPDVDGWIAETQLRAAQMSERLHAQEQATGELRFAAEAARKPVQEFQDALLELTRITVETAPIIALGDAVSAARGGINTRHMTLQSYAVQRRFESVLSAASIHLARMSAGKYSLELDEEAKGNAQAGLGIKVRDEWTGQARDPRSLSGGETFYAALALALGLADVVRDEAGGSQLETLFVDEGFGSLDQESLQLVLDQLDLLRSGGRIVGVVSHVTEMKEWVQQRVEVSVGPDRTSRLRTLP